MAAKLSGVGNLGKPQLVDGYANGWLITPKSSDLEVSLDWTPQNTGVDRHRHLGRLVAHLPADGAAPRARQPIRRRRPPDRTRRPGARQRGRPVLVSPFAKDPGRSRMRRAVIATRSRPGAGVRVLITPMAGLIVLVLHGRSRCVVPRGRTLLRVGSVARPVRQRALRPARCRPATTCPRPASGCRRSTRSRPISWLAAALLVADVLVGWARRDLEQLAADQLADRHEAIADESPAP